MKRILALMCMGVMLSFGTAHALSTDGFWMGTVNTGVTNDGTLNNVVGLDWSSSGSGVGVSLGENGTLDLATASTGFTFLYQSYLAGFTTNGGGAITAPMLNSTYEFTVVATIYEQLVGLSNLTGTPATPGFNINGRPLTALFQTISGTYTIYMDAVDANVLLGTGFANGTPVATGTFTPGEFSAFTITSASNVVGAAATGIGSATLTGTVDSYDASVFSFDTATGLPIFSFRVENTLNQPALDSITLQMFNGHVVDLTNNLNPDGTIAYGDAIFKVDASSKFGVEAIPEPSTILLLGVGLLGLAGYGKKRMKI